MAKGPITANLLVKIVLKAWFEWQFIGNNLTYKL